jgi:PAS domain S-box-containing protein
MEQLLTFAALIQIAIITLFLGTKATFKKLPTLLFFLLMVHYSLVLFLSYWNLSSTTQLSKLHLPIGYASGPLFYFFVRFGFLPIKNVTQRWLLWFIPFVIEFSAAIIYWVLSLFNTSWAEPFKNIAVELSHWNFIYFIAFFIATIVFLFKNNALITMNIVYKKQLKWLKVLIGFTVLFIFNELITSRLQDIFSSSLACAFASTFVYFLLSNGDAFSVQNQENKEVLKEALSEREVGVVITNKAEIVEYVNESFLSMIGYRHRDVIGRKLSFLQGALTTPESVDFIRQKLREQVEFEADIINYRKNGEAYIFHLSISPVFTNNKLTHYVAYEKDIKTISEAMPFDDELMLLKKIKTHFDTTESYKNKQLQVADVADAVGISARRVGETLKKCEDKSFSEFVNAYRVQAVIKMLQETDNQQLTIESIGQICGFNSKSVFHTAFKKETGKTPKNYLETDI